MDAHISMCWCREQAYVLSTRCYAPGFGNNLSLIQSSLSRLGWLVTQHSNLPVSYNFILGLHGIRFGFSYVIQGLN